MLCRFELARRNNLFLSSIPIHPISANVLLTRNCNSRCITCSTWKEKHFNELTTKELFSLLSQLRQLNIINLYLTGGEPLLRVDLSTILSKARHLGFEKIHLATNGLLLTENRARELVERGVNVITVSLNGIEDTHDVTRGIPGSYERVIKALHVLTKVRSDFPALEIGIQTILTEQNLDQIPDLIKLCENMHISFSLCLLDNSPFLFRGAPDLGVKNFDKLDALLDKLHEDIKPSSVVQDTHGSLEYTRKYYEEDHRRVDIPCYLGYLSVHIGSFGEVYSGCDVLPSMGNIRDKPLHEIITSPEYAIRVRQMFLKKCPGCSCGHRLNLYAHLPAVLDEALWMLHFKIAERILEKKLERS